jgi:DNA-binding NtrC family response regulator
MKDVVVCVDDDPQILAALRRLLRREPYELVTTESAQQMMEWIGREEVALVVADLRMPDVTGTDLLDVVRQRSPATARMLLTAWPERDAMRHPAVQVLLCKPWDDDELKGTVRWMLHARRGDAASREVVLCVDDEPAVLDALVRALRHEPYTVITTGDWRQAIEWMSTRGVAVAVVDQLMPGASGVEVLRRIGSVAPGAGRILLTGFGDGDVVRECRRMGVQRFLSKPCADEDLRRAIHDVLAERKPVE